MAQFQPIETDGSALVEVYGKEGILGSARIPVPTAVLLKAPAPIPTVPPIPVTFGEPGSLPIHRTNGHLELTLRSFDLRALEKPVIWGQFQLDALWRGQPIVPEIGFLAITDRFGRREMLFPRIGEPLMIQLAPHEAIWDLHFQVYRNLENPLDPDEMVQVTPRIMEGEPLYQQEGSHRGRTWRLTFIPSGRASFPARFQPASGRFRPMNVTFTEDVPVIVVECDPVCPMRVRIEALDHEGEYFPANGIGSGGLVPNVFAARSAEFDATEGDTIQLGFDEPRVVQFTIRPEIANRQ